VKGSKRSGKARGGALALLLAFAPTIVGCQDGYPIAATRCDRWCDLLQTTECGGYTPASCVVTCEQSFAGAGCTDDFDAVLHCLEMHRSELKCADLGSPLITVCETEIANLRRCAMPEAPAPNGR
jgi:hypothetical protein